ncbi:MAG: PAS domain-containing protein, partial [Actinomycetota bacterium]|nr:PAS domain-containing protein [Actinomycetota bacterium]
LPLLGGLTKTDMWMASARYFLGFTGSLLGAIGLWLVYQSEVNKLMGVIGGGIMAGNIKKYFIASAGFLGAYGILGGLIVTKAGFFPASVINNDTFLALFSVPVQLFRAALAVGLMWSMWHIADVFNMEKATAQMRAVESIMHEKNQAQEYLKIAPVILMATDNIQRVTMINKRGCEVLGYPENEIIGKNWVDSFVPPEVRDEVKRGLMQKSLGGQLKSADYLESPVQTKDGRKRTIAWNRTAITETGQIIGILSTGEDITETGRLHAAQ